MDNNKTPNEYMSVLHEESGDTLEFPVGTDPEIVKSTILKQYGRPNPEGTAFTRGIGRGIDTTAALVTEGIPALAKSTANKVANEVMGIDLGLDPMENFTEYNRKVEEAYQKNPRLVQSFKDIENFGDTALYIGAVAGESLPQLAFSMAGGGVGGFAAKKGAQHLAKKAGKTLTDKELRNAVNKGLAIGALTSSGSMNVPESYFNLLAEGEDDPLAAIATGALKTSLDVLPQMGLLKKLIGPQAATKVSDNILKSTLKQGGKTALSEGATEAAQTELDLIAEYFVTDNKDLFSPENITELIDSGIMGAIGGGIAGGAVGGLTSAKDTRTSKVKAKDMKDLDPIFQEEVVKELAELDNNVIPPMALKPATVDSLKNMGLDIESVIPMSNYQAESIVDSIGKPMTPDLFEIEKQFDTRLNAKEEVTDDGKKLDFYKARLDKLKGGTRIDTNFVLGDGEISFNAPTYEDLSFTPVTKNAKVLNHTKVKKKIDETLSFGKNQFMKQQEQPSLVDMLREAEDIAATDPNKQLVIEVPSSVFKNENFRKQLKAVSPIVQPKYKENKDTVSIKIPKSRRKEIQNLATPYFQQFKVSHPTQGDFYSDYTIPAKTDAMLQTVPLTQKGREQWKDVIGNMERIVKEIAGPDIKLQNFEAILAGPTQSPVLGAQVLNTVNVALNPNTTVWQAAETMYHESWHMLERMGAISDKDLQILNKNIDKLFAYANEDGYLSSIDIAPMLETTVGREELRANAFGKYAVNKGNMIPDKAIERVFAKVKNIFERLRNALNGLGFRSFNDIFENAVAGKNAVSQLADLSALNAQARYQRMQEEYNDVHRSEMRPEDIEKSINEVLNAQNAKNVTDNKNMSKFTEIFHSIKKMAEKNPIIAALFDLERRKQKLSNTLLTKYESELSTITKAKPAYRHRLHSLAKMMKDTDQKAELDNEGALVFYRGTEDNLQKVRIKDRQVAKDYLQLQKAYGAVLTDFDMNLREMLFNGLPQSLKKELGDITKLTDEKIKSLLEITDAKTDPTLYSKLNNAVESINTINGMKSKDFVPDMRFGDYGVTVRDKQTKEQIGFYTVEAGNFRKRYDEFQMDELKSNLQKYLDEPTKYDVIDGNGKLTDVNKLEPFKLTYNKLKDKGTFDEDMINFEMLSSLLYSKDINMKDYQNIKDEIFGDILEKGFAKRFSKNKGIEGSSQDWDRVSHAYFSGASHFLSAANTSKEEAYIKSKVPAIRDPRVEGVVNKYLEYMSSPEEDFQKLRSFNFIWTMGLNTSTALLQTMTLPTSTSAVMNQYNPNYFQNLKSIGKWTKFAVMYLKHVSSGHTILEDGSVYTDIADPTLLRKLVKKGTITQAQANHLFKGGQEGIFKATQTEEYVGYQKFETRSLGGALKGKMAKGAQMLGIPISLMENATRIATNMALFEMFETKPHVKKKALEILKNDARFQALVNNDKSRSETEHLANFSMDEAHAVFGKIARPQYQRGILGVMAFPFMTYPHQMLELLGTFYGRGADGKRALAVMLFSLMFFSGLIGLPGAELAKELYEEIEKQVTGSEEDIDLLIREATYGKTGSRPAGKMITQGFFRAYMNTDIARRIGLTIPGQDLLLNILGVRGNSSDVLGVQGSVANSIVGAFGDYMEGESTATVLAGLSPVAVSNVLKGYAMKESGVKTRRNFMLLPPEEVSAADRIARVIGFTTDTIAERREEAFFSQIANRKHRTGITKFRNRAKGIMERHMRASRNNDYDEVLSYKEDYDILIQELINYVRDNEIASFDFASFNRSIIKAAGQRQHGGVQLNSIRKAAREDVLKLQDVILGDNKEKE